MSKNDEDGLGPSEHFHSFFILNNNSVRKVKNISSKMVKHNKSTKISHTKQKRFSKIISHHQSLEDHPATSAANFALRKAQIIHIIDILRMVMRRHADDKQIQEDNRKRIALMFNSLVEVQKQYRRWRKAEQLMQRTVEISEEINTSIDDNWDELVCEFYEFSQQNMQRLGKALDLLERRIVVDLVR
ncbi:3284_t:CDS:2 [Ambispora gerdemannii]|uniref:3284_t:CDS:1 n=1 Tax=Ambispora gerdemannii TaxID=144530 RepID=A0A9N9F442_9GLOM|nr:3284_t:CDS:2 [Ambispora gerdemannii]